MDLLVMMNGGAFKSSPRITHHQAVEEDDEVCRCRMPPSLAVSNYLCDFFILRFYDRLIFLHLLGFPSGLGTKRVRLIGLGKAPITSSSSVFAYRSLGESVALSAKTSQGNNVVVALASSHDLTIGLKLTTASTIATGALLGTYEDNIFKYESKKPSLKSIGFLNLGEVLAEEAEKIASTINCDKLSDIGFGTTDCLGHVGLVTELMKKTKPKLKSSVVVVYMNVV
ncbi:unnamed protein product [Lactuca saligna]|uniref:Peptidase M17 leucyl aminopeptidase N-terminal domain-containing protein n=1 Tax=Lactuca saligna TaxID=75948 RepID=A0AA35UU30_LACSI|nr:unnamed protein product [Lactuca saligna]